MPEFRVMDLGRIYRDQDAYKQNALAAKMQEMQIRKAQKAQEDENALAQIFQKNYQPDTQAPEMYQPQGPMQDGSSMPAVPTGNMTGSPGGMNMRGAINEMYQRFPMQAMQFEQNLRKAQGETPSSIKEWQLYNGMPPEDRMRYLEMKRSQQFLNLGNEMRLPGTGGAPDRTYRVNLKPGELPSVKGAQAGAEQAAKTAVTQEAERTKKATQANTMTSYIDEADKMLTDASSGYIGTARAYGKRALSISDTETQANEKLRLISGWMVANVPRMEGPQSNYDVENYKTMAARVGDPTVPIGDRKASLAMLRGLQQKYTALNAGGTLQQPPEQDAPKPGIIKGGYVFMGGDPANQKNWKPAK